MITFSSRVMTTLLKRVAFVIIFSFKNIFVYIGMISVCTQIKQRFKKNNLTNISDHQIRGFCRGRECGGILELKT